MQTDKPYRMEIEDRGDYLYVLVGGDKLTADIAASYWREIADVCFDLKKNKILIEKDFAQSVSPLEMVHMGNFLGQLLANKKIAFFDRYGNEDINELGKKIARNRNVIMQTFQNIKDVEKWILTN
jgi:hypothetical protein